MMLESYNIQQHFIDLLWNKGTTSPKMAFLARASDISFLDKILLVTNKSIGEIQIKTNANTK